jgi:hypothetical protein
MPRRTKDSATRRVKEAAALSNQVVADLWATAEKDLAEGQPLDETRHGAFKHLADNLLRLDDSDSIDAAMIRFVRRFFYLMARSDKIAASFVSTTTVANLQYLVTKALAQASLQENDDVLVVAIHALHLQKTSTGEFEGCIGDTPRAQGSVLAAFQWLLASFLPECGLKHRLGTTGSELYYDNSAHWTAINAAAAQNEVELIRLLVERGADPEGRQHSALYSPVFMAFVFGHLEAFNALLELGAKPSCQFELAEGNEKRRPAQPPEVLFHILIRQFTNFGVDRRPASPEMLAARRKMLQLCVERDPSIVTYARIDPEEGLEVQPLELAMR